MRCANQLDRRDWVSEVCMFLCTETALGRPDSVVGRHDYTLNVDDTHTHMHAGSYVKGKRKENHSAFTS